METHKLDDEYDNGTPAPSDQSPSLACQVSLLVQSMKEMQSNMQLLISQRLGDSLGEGYSMSSTVNDDHNLLSNKWSGGPPGEGMRKAHKWKRDDDNDSRSPFSDSNICGLIKPKKGTNPRTTESTVLDELVKDLEEGETSGPEVNPKLASILNKRFRVPLSLDKLKQKQEKYSMPSNCESLDVPQLNKEVKDMIRTCTVTVTISIHSNGYS